MSGGKPDFLIVGAMKGGTTTLFYDLARHPDLFLPEPKEPEILVRREQAEDIRKAYATHFRHVRPGQLCGEASTAYTKRPDHEGVAERALQALGPELRILYITRDPVLRAVSHYKHDLQHGQVSGSFESAVHCHRRFVDYGRYSWQIAPWQAAFGEDRVKVVQLSDYSAARREMLKEILNFIGVDPARLGEIDVDARANSAAEPKHIDNALLRSVILSDFYQQRIKGFIPRDLRERARRAILPSPPANVIDIQPELRAYILEKAGG